jgi:hypothetical protein
MNFGLLLPQPWREFSGPGDFSTYRWKRGSSDRPMRSTALKKGEGGHVDSGNELQDLSLRGVGRGRNPVPVLPLCLLGSGLACLVSSILYLAGIFEWVERWLYAAS